MKDLFSDGIVQIKTEFAKLYDRNSHLHEVIPLDTSKILPINEKDLEALHNFAKNNPIYDNSFEMTIKEVNCTVYEGDINNYWLDSIKHDTSYAPFYPTWILSAYARASHAKKLNVENVIDIGSGDGRIAYCCQMLGMKSFGIEIDENLVELQKEISKKTGIIFDATASDATQYDFKPLMLKNPAFFIGGLPEVGEILANSIIENISSISEIKENSTFVLTGTNAKRKTSREHKQWGWGTMIDNFGLNVISTITLPTRWTIDQPIDTPYVFTAYHTIDEIGHS